MELRPLEAVATTPSEKMRSIGAVQDPAPILRRVAAPFALPDEAEDARRGVAELHSALGRASRLHHFAKGSGVAAPQLGIGRAAAVVRTPDGETITLLDPHVIEESADTDEQHEGCWSFFDVRGKVARSLGIHVAHQDVDGTPRITSFGEAVARLVAHEVDHLHGVLYVDRMPPGACTVRVGDYRATGLPGYRRTLAVLTPQPTRL
ncbi:MAG TPA: peptide deformylase [Mycobacteriales bacterium]|nr:peptide deformylase [Mycobacteriales bacterium]